MTYNPESHFFTPSAEKLPEAEEALYAVLVPENKKRAIQLKDFADLYGAEVIARDEAYVQDREKKFGNAEGADSNKKFGELFEAIINYNIENLDMMGPNAEVIVPSKYDDIANGIDTFIQFTEERGATSHLALAIDVTGSEMEIGRKFAKVQESIARGNLSVGKYFKSDNFRGELPRVARVVIGAGHEVTEEISDLILRFERMKKTLAQHRGAKEVPESVEKLREEFRHVREQMAEHPLHAMVLTQIKAQLEAAKKYADRKGKTGASEECDKILHIIDNIIADKETISTQLKDPNFPGNTDGVYRMIMEKSQDLANAE